MIPIYAAVILVGTALRNKLDLHCTLCRAFGAGSGSGNGYLADSIGSWSDVSEETVARFEQVVLHVDSVKSDVESTLRQAVDG